MDFLWYLLICFCGVVMFFYLLALILHLLFKLLIFILDIAFELFIISRKIAFWMFGLLTK